MPDGSSSNCCNEYLNDERQVIVSESILVFVEGASDFSSPVSGLSITGKEKPVEN
jgi:hypothetical protein